MIDQVVDRLPDDLAQFADLARVEGHHHLHRLIADWASGETRFDAQGEALYVATDGGATVGIGGLTRCPFWDGPDAGRVRRVYVAPNYRRLGVGRQLLDRIIDKARGTFSLLTLYTGAEPAKSFYAQAGFEPGDGHPKVSHLMRLDR